MLGLWRQQLYLDFGVVQCLQLHVNAWIMATTALFRFRRSLVSTATCEYWDYDGNSFI